MYRHQILCLVDIIKRTRIERIDTNLILESRIGEYEN